MSVAAKALELLIAHSEGRTKLSRKAGSFAGQCVTDPQPLTEAQADWLDALCDRAGIEPVEGI